MGYEEEDAVNNFRAMSPPRRPVLTGVDILMQTLEGPPASSTNDDSPPSSRSGKVKQHLCPFQHCNKAFAQPSQLKIHVRSHTGEKPFQCHVLGCGAAFSQLGNLRTHEGRHREEKPRRQSQPQSSSTSVHSTRRYACKLDGCKEAGDGHGKAFSQLGNLKMHMNKFHRETIARLSRVFNDRDRSRTQQELELTNYFKSLYRNCNRGLRTKAEE
ncbi:DNA-binding transcription factor [Knufia fluminis]|uniref:C2H2 type master regulator of conidiophore development brlA n=1 Tax=Knufia fluminis TaxID=191047 RepID=A0AAN8EQW1_9EURO|nr:DNA-binding transcription factor [Knufia fluminis]